VDAVAEAFGGVGEHAAELAAAENAEGFAGRDHREKREAEKRKR
jgi:hypothetical protein